LGRQACRRLNSVRGWKAPMVYPLLH
jgi:hypothetical protein